MENIWDTRFSQKEYAYGVLPNAFFKSVLDTYNVKGKLLLPAEGEGRNAVYGAKKGLEIYAFDTSKEGCKKALKLAKENKVTINYEVGEFDDLELLNEKFDVVALIFAHFSIDIVSEYHKKITSLLNPNGLIILEGFSKSHLEYQKNNPKAGGPKKLEMLFSKETIKRDFPDFEILKLEEIETELQEGLYHQGKAKVIRFIGRKN